MSVGTYEEPIEFIWGSKQQLRLGLFYLTECHSCGTKFRWKFDNKEKGQGRRFCSSQCVFINQLKKIHESLPMEITLSIKDMSRIIYAYRIQGEHPVDIATRMGLDLAQVHKFINLPLVESTFTLWNRPSKSKYVNVYDITIPPDETPNEEEQQTSIENLKSRRLLTLDEKRDIIERHKRGESASEIAKLYNASLSNVRLVIRLSKLADKSTLEPEKKEDKDFLKRIRQYFYKSEV